MFPIIFIASLIYFFFRYIIQKNIYLTCFRRSLPIAALSIGAWVEVMDFITYVAIFTNVGLSVYANENIFKDKNKNWQMLTFFLAVFFLIFLKMVMSFGSGPSPKEKELIFFSFLIKLIFL